MGAKMVTKFARRAEKNNNRLIFDENRFLGSENLDLGSSIHLHPFSEIARRVDSVIRKDFQVYSF